MNLPISFPIIAALWGAFFVLVVILATLVIRAESQPDRDFLWVVLGLTVAVNAWCSAQYPFFGMEYEDAYEYLYSGELLINFPALGEYGLNPICVAGSLISCLDMATLSHPIGASVLYGVIIEKVGWGLSGRMVLLLLMYLATAITAYCSARVISGASTPSALAVFLISLSPMVIVYSGTTFSELAGAAVVSALLFALLTFIRTEMIWVRYLSGGLLAVSSCLAPLIKRELVLFVGFSLIVAVIFGVLQWQRKRLRSHVSIAVGLVFIGIAAAFILSNGQILNTDVAKTSQASAFSLAYFPVLAPAYFKYLVIGSFFFPMGILFVISLVASARRGTPAIIAMGILVMILQFLFFSQDYYFATNGRIPTIHFERYTFQLWPLVVVLVAAMMARFHRVIDWSELHRKRVVAGLVVVGVAGGIWASGYSEERSSVERNVRVLPIREASRVIPEGSVVLTFEPILFSLFGNESYRLVDIASLGTLISAERLEEVACGRDVFLVLSGAEEDRQSDQERYPTAFEILEGFGWKEVARVGDGEGQRWILRGSSPVC